jgi:hypothetical protein
MNPLAWLSPGRWLLALGLLLALWLGYHAWADHQQGIGYGRAKTEDAERAKQADKARAAVAAPIEAAHQAKAAAIVTVTKTIIKDRYVYVKDTDCALSGGFRVLHDAAAHGVLPQPAAIADAAAAPAADVADTVATNYGTCHQIAERLTALQAWVRAQQDLKP